MFAQLRKAGSEHRTYGLRREAGPARREGSRSRDVSARHCRRRAASRTCCLGSPFVTPKTPQEGTGPARTCRARAAQLQPLGECLHLVNGTTRTCCPRPGSVVCVCLCVHVRATPRQTGGVTGL